MPIRDWDALSSDYRNRLQRGGITKSAYESGTSLSTARGHKNTPERPERASTDIGRYGNYLADRNRLIRDIVDVKRLLWGDRPKWSEKGAKNVLKNHSMASLRRMQRRLENIWNDIDDDFDYPEEDDDALRYH